MADRYKVKDVVSNQIVWEGMAKDGMQAIVFATAEKKLSVGSTLSAEKVDSLTPIPPQAPVKARKPRADAGGKHNKAEKLKKRHLYHLIEGVVHTCKSKDELDDALDAYDPMVQLLVIEGGSVHSVECQKTWKLA